MAKSEIYRLTDLAHALSIAFWIKEILCAKYKFHKEEMA